MKFLIALCVISTASLALAKLNCEVQKIAIDQKWIDITSGCVAQTRTQIQEEMNASIQYLAMAAHFSQDTVNRPGFAKFFFDAASEEREHSMKLIEYLLMRGELIGNVTALLKVPTPEIVTWTDGVTALKDALVLEAKVTQLIRKLIETCETSTKDIDGSEKQYNDYHFVDYLTGVYLEEQHKGQRHLAGMISTLGKMQNKHGNLGEFLFDKELLE